jgi:hypothetical protein
MRTETGAAALRAPPEVHVSRFSEIQRFSPFDSLLRGLRCATMRFAPGDPAWRGG